MSKKLDFHTFTRSIGVEYDCTKILDGIIYFEPRIEGNIVAVDMFNCVAVETAFSGSDEYFHIDSDYNYVFHENTLVCAHTLRTTQD